ncbi:MAG: AAA family ATPase [Verrucomicrobia bacterium]|nr:AAA family ATPase [Verrucomicrobiota bacterium]
MASKLTKFPLDESRTLLTKPENTSIPRVFVAATRQNDGKTTTCLGLYAALQAHLKDIGYIKPIGQRFIDMEGLKIDEDTWLLDSVFKFDVPIEAMSPVAIDPSFTRRFLDDPAGTHPLLMDKIARAFDRSTFGKKAVIIEGSGHAGVGSVCDLSNAQVARLLRAKAIIVSSGGIGKPVDEIALNKSLFDKFGVEVLGAIINKVQPERFDVINNYTRKGLERLGIPLLAILPEVRELAAPNLQQIVEELGGRWINGRDHGRQERIHRIVVGAMTARGVLDYFQPGVLIITPGDREDVLVSAIAASGVSGRRILSGIVLTTNILPHPRLMDMLAQTNIPVVLSNEDSYTVASKIHSMTVKTQPQDTDKIPLITRLVSENLNTEALIPRLTPLA